MQIILATKNEGKVREFKQLMKDLPLQIRSLKEKDNSIDIEESGETFKENAVIKARVAAERFNQTAVADDSGLEVDFLEGRPGVFSARFAGQGANDRENNQKLLKELKGVPDANRTARFRCSIALVTPDGNVFAEEGTCEGVIGHVEKGDSGFGYDPLFYVPEFKKTFAELDMETKNRISHRAKAYRKAREILTDLLLKYRET